MKIHDTGLTPVFEPVNPAVDIVFVHGLQGHPRKTWTWRGPKERTGNGSRERELNDGRKSRNPFARRQVSPGLSSDVDVYWPAELLSKDCPTARIMTFGYDSRVSHFFSGPANQSNIFAHARDLLYALNRERSEAQGRPLICVAHSLGGIILKETLRRSSVEKDPVLHDIVTSTRAVFFLGTPHRGSDWTDLGDTVRRIVSAAGLDTAGQNLHTLRFDSSELEICQEGFLQLYLEKAFQVRSFQEGQGMAGTSLFGLNRKVVENFSSALIGDAAERCQTINANHMQMCRFPGRDDDGYRKVCGELLQVVAAIKREKQMNSAGFDSSETAEPTPEEQAYIRTLHFSEMYSRQYDIEQPSESTCTWLFQHPHYQVWQREGGLLWISGKPGAGKSTLMEFARRSETQSIDNGNTIILSFYFHGRGTDLQKSIVGLLRSLLHTLLLNSWSLRSKFEPLFKSKRTIQGQPGSDWVWHARELQDLLDMAFSEVIGIRPIKVFVDALDECGEDAASKLVSYFQRLTSRMIRRGRWHLCFSCRHYPVLNVTGGSEICIDEENSSDISAYIWTALESCPTIRPQISQEIARRASGVFQWVSLVIPLIIRLHSGGMSLPIILVRLQDVPRDLTSLYRRIVLELDPHDRKMAFHLLQWICFPERPLRVPELRKALYSDGWAIYRSPGKIEQSMLSFNLIEDDQQVIQMVNYLSGGLAEVKSQSISVDEPGLQHPPDVVVQLVHQSVKDFMVEEGLKILNPKSLLSVVGSAQHRLARSCMAYALEALPQRPKGRSRCGDSYLGMQEKFDSEKPDSDTFYNYAVEFSLIHAEKAEDYDISQEDLLDILSPLSQGSDDVSQNKSDYLSAISQHYLMDQSKESHPPFFHIIAQFNIFSLMKSMTETITDINERDLHGITALHRCAETGSLEAVRFLLQHGADDTIRDHFGKSPLHRASLRSREQIVETLSSNPRSLNARDLNGLTPLHDAVLAILQGDSKQCWVPTETSTSLVELGIKDSDNPDARSKPEEGRELIETIDILLRRGSKLNAKDAYGRTPLHLAVTRQLEAVTRQLLAKDEIDINAKDAKGCTPILTAAQLGAFESIKILFERSDINVDHKSDDGRTLLSYVAGYKLYHIEAFVSSLLARNDVAADSVDNCGRTPLSYACSHGAMGTIQILLAHGNVDPYAKDNQGRTPLSYFCSYPHMYGYDSVSEKYSKTMKLILSKTKAESDSKDKVGRTPLSYAAEVGNWKVADELISRHGALRDSQDATGKTPIWWANYGRQPDLVMALQDEHDLPPGYGKSIHRRRRTLASSYQRS